MPVVATTDHPGGPPIATTSGRGPDLAVERVGATLRPPPVKVRSVSKCYGADRVLDDVSLTVVGGDYLGLIGPNGSGKSTLLRAMVGLEQVEGGSVELFGTPLAHFADRGRIGYVPQHVHQTRPDFPATVLDVVLMGRLSRKGRLGPLLRSDRSRAAKALAQVGMESFARRRVGELSGGERQRVFIAKELCHDPELLILDEPTTGVDASSQDQFFSLLHRLNHDDGLTIILVSNDLPVVMARATTVACLSRTIHYHGKPEGLLRGDVLERVFGQDRHLVLGEHRHEHLHHAHEHTGADPRPEVRHEER